MNPEQLLGRYLRGLRLMHGLTLEELAKRIGISRGYLNQIELGRRKCSIMILSKMASIFDLSVSDILDSSGYSKFILYK